MGMWKIRINTQSRKQTTHVVGTCVCMFSKDTTIPFDTFCDMSLNRLRRTRCAFTITIITNLNVHHLNYNPGKLITQMLWKLMCCISPQASHVVSLSLFLSITLNTASRPQQWGKKKANPGTHSDAGLSSRFIDAQRSAVVIFLKKRYMFPRNSIFQDCLS